MDPSATAEPSKHVKFLGKCQVIPPVDYGPEDAVEDYFSRQPQSASHKLRSSGRLSLFRSRKSRSRTDDSRQAHHERRSSSSSVRTPPPPSDSHPKRPESAPLRLPSLSPSLPISRDGTANRLRQKLVSPPPPPSDDPISPSTLKTVPLPAWSKSTSPPPASPDEAKSPASPLPQSGTPITLARPVAVRKPLTFGFDKEEPPEAILPTLHVPPIVYVSHISEKQQAHQHADDRDKQAQTGRSFQAAVLKWTGDDEESSSSSGEEDDNDEDEEEECEFEEEDLRGECQCLGCEAKMTAALAPSYRPPWTRNARRKYLADCKEAQNEESRKAVRPPIWLSTEDSETAAENAGLARVRDIQADEVDEKRGVTERESVAKKSGLANGQGELTSAIDADVDDLALRKEVDAEVRLREEEQRLRKTRTEMHRLSGDVGSGLRMGGGGARAMMRQLDEADQAERRARMERSRSSPRLPEQALHGREQPMRRGSSGGVSIPSPLPSKTYTPPPRIASPIAKSPAADPATKAPKASSASLVARASSPLATPKAKEPTSVTKEKNATQPSSSTRHPPQSLLINRELKLGIPVQSNTLANASARSRQTWHNAASESTQKGESRSATAPPIPSPQPKPNSISSSQSKAKDDSESTGLPKGKPSTDSISSSAARERGDSAPPRSASLDRSSKANDATHTSNDDQGRLSRKNGDQQPSEAPRPSVNANGSIRRANTTGSQIKPPRQPGHVKGGGSDHGRTPLHTSSAYVPSSSTPSNVVEARIDKARAKAKSSFKDLVARIKG